MQSQSVPPTSKKSNWWKWLLGVVGALYIIGRCSGNDAKLATESASSTTSESPATTDVPKPAEPVSNWSYNEFEDKMGAKLKTATVTASELLQFEFPYNGGSEATITLRKKGGTTDIALRVSKGQFNTSIDGGTARIRFDSGQPKTYSWVGPSDNSHDVIFFNSEKSIINNLKKAKKIVVEVEFYSAGNRQIEFNVDGLKWQ